MKIFYLILLGALCALPMKANSQEFAGRHPMAQNREMSLKQANIQKVTEEAKARLLSSPAKTAEQPSGYSMEGIEVLNPVKGQILIEKKGNSVRKVII